VCLPCLYRSVYYITSYPKVFLFFVYGTSPWLLEIGAFVSFCFTNAWHRAWLHGRHCNIEHWFKSWAWVLLLPFTSYVTYIALHSRLIYKMALKFLSANILLRIKQDMLLKCFFQGLAQRMHCIYHHYYKTFWKICWINGPTN
jgi:hypothetical protein